MMEDLKLLGRAVLTGFAIAFGAGLGLFGATKLLQWVGVVV